jgi:hypothetical protein
MNVQRSSASTCWVSTACAGLEWPIQHFAFNGYSPTEQRASEQATSDSLATLASCNINVSSSYFGIRPMMDYACPMWRFAAVSHVRKLLVLQSKFLRNVTNAPWYDSNRHIHEDLGILSFADRIRALTVCFNSKLADAGNPATWKTLVPTKGLLKLPTGNRGGLMLSRPAEAVPKKTAKSAQRVVSNHSASLNEVFRAFPQL